MVNEILFKKAVNGDKDSFIQLIEPIKEKLYKVAFVYLKNEDDALDCVHDGIIKAIKSLDTLKEPQYFNTWITRIIMNVCKDYIKKNSKVVLVDINDYEDKLISEDNKNDINYEIKTALNKLSEKERNLIVMRYLEDNSLKDIVTKTNLPLGTVKSRLNRTLIKLRKYMKEA
ncbi:sigma-70 family RNA polymerase sigma factor [Clostridium sp. Sa3CUN1]|uniref:Sigma-70 family RNA polymerase sigma factor n=1 Tax=Clostridium gallinarum TaxID=2762246 RepID=A0ABR8Q5E7_9CLOT|nr:sigma-70 family RNA polymerase sigma factor [Clostridium gallinarum]MBD7915600.1 sigma-70 family RNA polymerase sigma factor [Clostridium gallinarum]